MRFGIVRPVSLFVHGLLVLLLFSSCRKDEPVGPGVGYRELNIDAYLQSNFLFQAGSYWVYRDSASQAIDSVYNNGPETYDYVWLSAAGPGPQNKYWNTVRYMFNHTTHPAVQFNYYLRRNALVHRIIVRRDTVYSFIPDAIVYSNGQGLDTSATVQLIPGCVIAGVPYQNVYRAIFRNSAENSWDVDSGCVYLKPGLGVLRAECYYPNGSFRVFDLLRYYIR